MAGAFYQPQTTHPDPEPQGADLTLSRDRWIARDRKLGVRFERVMSDNGSCYRSKACAKTCAALGPKHIRTMPHTPAFNGKAEAVHAVLPARPGLWAPIKFQSSERQNDRAGRTAAIGTTRMPARMPARMLG